MRFITFLGLVMIAKCIDPNRIADSAGFTIPILIISIIVDIYELRLKGKNK
jgi:hypothetical protein